jgi:dTDP-4-amino-4,6-dideoxygalactose transaminase
MLLDAFDSNWIAPAGPHLDAFEAAMAERIGVDAVALSSGTAALHLALLGVGVRRGDTVLVSDLTFAASANAVTYVGARPAFVDSDDTSWNMDPDLLAADLAARARRGALPAAVLVVDLYGQSADYDRIGAVCDQYGVPVVEDAAEGLGATYRNRPCGSFGACAALSFNGNKIITTSGGGMLLSADPELVRRARYRSTQAREPVAHYEHREIGFNYRMSNLLAALGSAQLSALDGRVAKRRATNRRYRQALEGVDGIAFMPEADYGRPSNWLTVVTIDPDRFGASAEQVRLHLARHGIEARPAWKPMHLQPVFAGCDRVGGAVGERIFERGLCLPSGSTLTELEQEQVIDVFQRAPRMATR